MDLKMKEFFGLCCLFAAGVACGATTVVSQPFATATEDLTSITGAQAGSWSGNGAVTNQTVGYSYSNSVGKPIGAGDKTYLSVNGTVTCTTATTENKPATVDMMIQIAKPDVGLELPDGETSGNVQIAVGVETNGTLKIYCKNKSDVPGWYSLGDAVYAEGEWHRVSFMFDYATALCQVRVDGEPMITANGYLTANTSDTNNGAWYKMNKASPTALASVSVIGSTAIDEVVIKDGEAIADVQPVLADADGKTSEVKNSWIEAQGITRAQVVDGTSLDGSGLTPAQKYLVGLDAADGEKFEMKTMTMANNKVTITHPKFNPQSGKVITIKYGSTTACSDGSVTADSDGSTEIEFSANSNVLYYTLGIEDVQN